MDDQLQEDQILHHYEKVLAGFNLNKSEIIQIRKAVIQIADQILDHYFDSLGNP